MSIRVYCNYFGTLYLLLKFEIQSASSAINANMRNVTTISAQKAIYDIFYATFFRFLLFKNAEHIDEDKRWIEREL